MNAKYIALIVILGVWVLLLLVFGILSWMYQVKHKVEIAKRKQYFADYHTLQEDFPTPTPLNLDLKLNDNEMVYAYEAKVQVYLQSGQIQKVGWLYKKYQPPAGENDSEIDLVTQTKTGRLRWIYSWQKANQHLQDSGFLATMVVTNHRVVFFNPQKKKSLSWSLVDTIAPIMVLVAKEFHQGFVIKTKTEVYEVVNHDLKTIVICQNLKKAQKGENHAVE